MPWAAAGAVAAAGIGAYSADKASKQQQEGAAGANGLNAQQYAETVNRNAPFYQNGIDALQILQRQTPWLTERFDPSTVMNDPSYKFGLDQGTHSLEGSLAARGLTDSGAALKEAARYGTDYGTTKLNDAFARSQAEKNQTFNILQGQVGTGQAAANNTTAAGGQFATNSGSNLIGAGDAAAAGTLAQGNVWGSLLNQGVSAYGRSNTGTKQSGVGGYGGFTPAAQSGPQIDLNDTGGYFADGGPVLARREPKVGTRSPLPSGGGGGLSREAVLQALDRAAAEIQARQQPTPGTVGALPTNPVTNPGGVRKAQMQELGLRNGGAVRGPGGPKDDVIPVMASNGEHVIDAEAVTALGGGDNARGQAVLNELRERAKAHYKKGARRG